MIELRTFLNWFKDLFHQEMYKPKRYGQSSTPHELAEQIRHTLFQLDLEQRLQHLSSQWNQLTGYSPTACFGESLFKYIHPSDIKTVRTWIRQYAHASPPSAPLHFRLIHQQGHVVWVELYANPWFDKQDNVAGITGTLLDISLQRQQAQRQDATNRALITIADHFSGMLFRCRNNHNWTMEYVSGGCNDLTGYAPDDLMRGDSQLSYAQLLHKDDLQRVWNEVQSCLQDNRPWRLAYRITTALGQEKWVWEQGVGIFSSNEELLFLEGVIFDITQAKLADPMFRNTTLFNNGTNHQKTTKIIDAIDSYTGGQPLLLLQMRIDNLHNLNFTYGSEYCDKLMQQIVRQLEQFLSPNCLCGRYHTDQILISTPLLEKSHAEDFVQQLRSRFLGPVSINDVDSYISLSIGWLVALDSPISIYQTLLNLDLAVSHAASLGGGKSQQFDYQLNNIKISANDNGW
ncbi:MAG: PAS domain-containing protein [Gammaproteobacteria bacterium]|nr:PAS domain-containing protein [Gammaproteobacteria bacterium]MDP6165096.1 PAS domain-containing protein [Gammaproteobacteria bacterium]